MNEIMHRPNIRRYFVFGSINNYRPYVYIDNSCAAGSNAS